MGKINDLKDQALATLRGKWGSFVGLTFIYILLYCLVSLMSQFGEIFTDSSFHGIAVVTTSLGGLLAFLIIPMEFGYDVAFLHSSRQDLPADIGDLFFGYKRFWHVFGTLVLKSLAIAAALVPCMIVMAVLMVKFMDADSFNTAMAVVLVFLCCALMIPGVIVSLAYAMVPYILRDKPDYSCSEILVESRMMMKGHKGELFLLYLSFIGWGILSALTFFIGLLWLAPYMQMTEFKFYEQLRAELDIPAEDNAPFEEYMPVEEDTPVEDNVTL